MKESKAMVKKEMAFMKKKGAPKSMIKHEEREHESFGMGRKTKKMAGGGMPEVTVTGTRRNPSVEGKVTVEDLGRYEIPSVSVEELGTIEEPTARDKAPAPRRGTVTVEPYEPGGMKRGGSVKSGGYRRVADGIASKGKTRGMVVKMASGGSVGGSYRRAADGIATKGKTKGKMVKMMMGGSCK